MNSHVPKSKFNWKTIVSLLAFSVATIFISIIIVAASIVFYYFYTIKRKIQYSSSPCYLISCEIVYATCESQQCHTFGDTTQCTPIEINCDYSLSSVFLYATNKTYSRIIGVNCPKHNLVQKIGGVVTCYYSKNDIESTINIERKRDRRMILFTVFYSFCAIAFCFVSIGCLVCCLIWTNFNEWLENKTNNQESSGIPTYDEFWKVSK